MSIPQSRVFSVDYLRAENEVLRELLISATNHAILGAWSGDLEKEYDIVTLVRRKLGAPTL